MEEKIRLKISEINNLIIEAEWSLQDATRMLNELENEMYEKNENSIIDINNLKRELKRDNLYTNELEDFFEQYMKYYNK